MRDSLMAICHQVKHDNCHAPKYIPVAQDGNMSRKGRNASYRELQAEIGQRLRWARELVEPNRAAFARVIGVDRTTVQKIEDGDRPPSVFNVIEFCHALHITPNYLLLGSMQGLDGELAAALAARHPELSLHHHSPSDPHNPGTASASDSAKRPKKPAAKLKVA